ncbi:pentapeptide repeat-containing protein [Leifsonia sp. EB34]|uniref:pentapeptide repeat-containing protein n=1 Tax=Leifsonia sp. EB34 TaxID=3156303 RepID=UPI003516A189
MSATAAPERALAADCASCSGLCCVALAFARSADFAFDKAAGEECVNLDDGFGCRIHPQLRERGFKGCTVFDCFGAGQHVTRHTFGGGSWRDDAGARAGMFAVFPIVRQLHELLWYLREALAMPAAATLHDALRASWDEVTEAADADPALILELDIDELRAPAAALLREAARLTREALTRQALTREALTNEPATRAAATPLRVKRSRLSPGADLLGADLRGADLRGAELRGALLIGADLRDADLTGAELIGADLRDARLDGAVLDRALYLTQPQVDAARGDASTVLPAVLSRPSHWASASH